MAGYKVGTEYSSHGLIEFDSEIRDALYIWNGDEMAGWNAANLQP